MADFEVSDQLKELVRDLFPRDMAKGSEACYLCDNPTERTTTIYTVHGAYHVRECLDCRYTRVKAQVDVGLRPASDLEEKNLPENRRGDYS